CIGDGQIDDAGRICRGRLSCPCFAHTNAIRLRTECGDGTGYHEGNQSDGETSSEHKQVLVLNDIVLFRIEIEHSERGLAETTFYGAAFTSRSPGRGQRSLVLHGEDESALRLVCI